MSLAGLQLVVMTDEFDVSCEVKPAIVVTPKSIRVFTAVHGDTAPDSKPALLKELMKLMRNGWPF